MQDPHQKGGRPGHCGSPRHAHRVHVAQRRRVLINRPRVQFNADQRSTGRRHIDPDRHQRPSGRHRSELLRHITVGDRTISATINNSDVSQDFIETPPITLPWYRNYDIEFITELAAPMTETGLTNMGEITSDSTCSAPCPTTSRCGSNSGRQARSDLPG